MDKNRLNESALLVEKEDWKKTQRQNKMKKLLTIASPIIMLLLWEFLSRTAIINPIFFPAPSLILETLFNMGATGELLEHIQISLYRILAGFLLGVIPAIALGLFIGMYSPIRHFFQPLIMALMPIPPLAMLPIILPVVINTAAGVMNIDKIYTDVAKNYGAKPKDFFFKIALPGSLPVMLEGIQMGQAIALLTIVAAEMIGATSGIGYVIWMNYKAFLLPQMFVGLVLISFFGYLFSLIIRGLQSKLVPWK